MVKHNRDHAIIGTITTTIEQQDTAALQSILQSMHPADIASVLSDIPRQHRAHLVQLLADDLLAQSLLELPAQTQLDILSLTGPDRASTIMNMIAADDIADLIAEVDAPDANEVLSLLETEHETDVRNLLNYPPESAGGRMTTEYIALPETMTAQQAIEHLRANAPQAETVYYVYVVSANNTLTGVLSLRDLIASQPTTKLSQFMETNIITVTTHDDQEHVAHVVAKYDLLAIPVIDQNNRLCGIITVDDIIDVIHEEATEDIHRMGGSLTGEEPIDSVSTRVRKRLPWLVILLFGSMLGASVLRGFTQTLEAVVILAYFIPVLIDMDGNVGIQSLTVTVRALATGNLSAKSITQTIFREAQVGLILGLTCGLLVTIVAYTWQGSLYLGLIVGVAMAVTMMVAALLGTIVPLIFDRIGVDAAVASGPFITTLCDVTGLLIYFSLATWLLRLI